MFRTGSKIKLSISGAHDFDDNMSYIIIYDEISDELFKIPLNGVRLKKVETDKHLSDMLMRFKFHLDENFEIERIKELKERYVDDRDLYIDIRVFDSTIHLPMVDNPERLSPCPVSNTLYGILENLIVEPISEVLARNNVSYEIIDEYELSVSIMLLPNRKSVEIIKEEFREMVDSYIKKKTRKLKSRNRICEK